jgi:hypothetical protein
VLFRLVVELNYQRILTRLRSRHMSSRKSERKVSLLQRLNTAMTILQASPNQSSRLPDLVREVQGLQQYFNELEAMDLPGTQLKEAVDCLVVMVKRIYSILTNYGKELESIPHRNKIWSGNSTEALLDRLRKISQYVEACDELLRAARRYKSFFALRVEFIDLQQSARPWDTVCDMMEVVDEICIPETLSRIPQRPGKPPTVTSEAMETRMSRMTSFLHGEIQLVLFYEHHDSILRPRVICASKSACYLCNLFLKLHGQFHIPDSHGKLYDGWVWPAPSSTTTRSETENARLRLQTILPEFARAIDHKIQESLDSPTVGKRNGPAESTVNLISIMTPSSQSLVPQPASGAATLLEKLAQVLERFSLSFQRNPNA